MLAAMQPLPNLKVRINGDSTLFLDQSIMSKYSGLVKRMVELEMAKKKKKGKNKNVEIKMKGFPGGSTGFELAARFCYSNGGCQITPANLPLLHSAAVFLEMGEELAKCNLHHQAETFLDGLFYWTWSDLLGAVAACEPIFAAANSSGLLHKLLSSLLTKIAAFPPDSSSSTSAISTSSSSSSECSTGGSSKLAAPVRKEWWFDDLTKLSPRMLEEMFKMMGLFGKDNNNLMLTRFLLHYLKVVAQRSGGGRPECVGLAGTAVHGVVAVGRKGFSCRGMLWVLRVVSGFGVGKGLKGALEGLIGGVLDEAGLDDLMVLGHGGAGVYDVGLVVRLLRVFVCEKEVGLMRLKKVGRLIDGYIVEISPDPALKVPKLLDLVEGLPDDARDSFDGVYKAIDIYLQTHPSLSVEEKSRLCKCLNYEKLSLECFRNLANNPRIPPRIAMQALKIRQSTISPTISPQNPSSSWEAQSSNKVEAGRPVVEKEEIRANLERMQFRVSELERVCLQMKSQMFTMAKRKAFLRFAHHINLPKLRWHTHCHTLRT